MSEFDFTPYGYKIIERLGQNIYGGRVTYKAINVNNQQPVVIKQFQFANDSNWEDYKAIEQEISILQKLDYPGIPRYLGHFDSGNGICLIQEYKNAQPLSIQSSFNFDEIKHIAISILEILVYLQNRNLPVIHRDIKPENILVDEQLNIYLVDFGFSKMGEGSVALSSMVAGTFGFMPPEQLHNLQLTKASDLYSLGATLICLITKTKSTQIGKLIDLSNNRLQFQHRMSGFSVEFIQWLEQMVQLDPNRRFPNADEALKVLHSLYITRSPAVKLSQCVLEFRATRLIEKLTRTLVIENSVPETILEGHLQVASNSKDPPHTPDTHAWIAIAPKNFKTNQVQCQIKVDTSKLKANSVYKRWILLHTNAALDPFKIQVQVHTASIPKETSTSSTIPELPYLSLLLLLIPAFVTTVVLWKVNAVFGNLLGEIFDAVSKDYFMSLVGGLLFGGGSTSYIGAGVGWGLGYVLASLFDINWDEKYEWGKIGAIFGGGISFFPGALSLVLLGQDVSQLVYIRMVALATMFVLGVGTIIIASMLVAQNCRDRFVKDFDVLILSRLIPAFGISLGVGLMVGLFNPFVIFALAATALPVARVMLSNNFYEFKQRKQIIQERQREKLLIEP